MHLEKLTWGQEEAIFRQSQLNTFFGEKQVTGPFLDQLHPEELNKAHKSFQKKRCSSGKIFFGKKSLLLWSSVALMVVALMEYLLY